MASRRDGIIAKLQKNEEEIITIETYRKKNPTTENFAASDLKPEVAKKPGELGMMAMAANPGNVIAMAPPLIFNRDDIDEGIAILNQALEAAGAYAEA